MQRFLLSAGQILSLLFLSSLFIAAFLSSLLENKSVNVVRSGSSCSVISGVVQFCSRQTRKIFGMPLPARSPISIRLNIFSIAPLRGSETPPLFAASISMRKLPGLDIVMEMSRNVQSGNTQNLKSMVIQRSFPKWSVAERRKTAAASDQAAVCACAHSRYFAGGSPSGLRV